MSSIQCVNANLQLHFFQFASCNSPFVVSPNDALNWILLSRLQLAFFLFCCCCFSLRNFAVHAHPAYCLYIMAHWMQLFSLPLALTLFFQLVCVCVSVCIFFFSRSLFGFLMRPPNFFFGVLFTYFYLTYFSVGLLALAFAAYSHSFCVYWYAGIVHV